MPRRLLIVLLALISLGFVVLTPEARRELDRARRAWHQDTRARWDRGALHGFLLRTLAEQQAVEGIPVTPRDAGRRFKPDHRRFFWKAGSWLFVCRDPTQDRFELRRYYAEKGWVVLVCHRDRRERFRVIDTKIDRLLQISPPAWAFEP